ncbi:MAG: hypothetical protein AABW87_02425 [Nanoarchaeota archaeon]|mgnify:FL=1
MAESALGSAIEFLRGFGFFDVVLPFLLVFTIVFGILEKTKILGVEGKDKLPKKNLNAMVAFSIAFFVVAASNIVEAIQVSLPAITMVLIIIIALMLLLGSFAGESGEKGFDLWEKSGWKWFLGAFVLVAVILIFVNAFGFSDVLLGYLADGFNSSFITTVVLLLLIAWAIYWVVGGKREEGGKK